MITNQGQMCHLHSSCGKEYTFMMCVNQSFHSVDLLLSNASAEGARELAYSGFSETQQINLIGPQSCANHLTAPSKLSERGSDLGNDVTGKECQDFEAGVFRDAGICQGTPACYRFPSPFCLPAALAHTSAVLTHNQLIWLSCSFRIPAIS